MAPRDYPEMPENLIMAKFRKLDRKGKGIVEGCDCGCRGDWGLRPVAALALGLKHGDPGVAWAPAEQWVAARERLAAEASRPTMSRNQRRAAMAPSRP